MNHALCHNQKEVPFVEFTAVHPFNVLPFKTTLNVRNRVLNVKNKNYTLNFDFVVTTPTTKRI